MTQIQKLTPLIFLYNLINIIRGDSYVTTDNMRKNVENQAITQDG